jgi:hypothetical protein
VGGGGAEHQDGQTDLYLVFKWQSVRGLQEGTLIAKRIFGFHFQFKK